jgi:hypothetical protein
MMKVIHLHYGTVSTSSHPYFVRLDEVEREKRGWKKRGLGL